MILFTLKLLLAHFLGDFTFQPSKWVKKRNQKGITSKYLYYHIAVHFFLLLLLFTTEIWKYYLGIIALLISHYIIDVAKIYIVKKGILAKFNAFLVDQLIHLIALLVVVQYYFPLDLNVEWIYADKILSLLLALILTVSVTPLVIKSFFQRWENELQVNNNESLKNAGLYIGILERLFIVLFIVMNFFEGIGYLLAAKSIFRFGDLTNAKDKKLTEYILLGTLLSFLMAIIIGLGLKMALKP